MTTVATAQSPHRLTILIRDRVEKIRQWLVEPTVVPPDRLTLAADGSGTDRSVLFAPNLRFVFGLLGWAVGFTLTLWVAATFATTTVKITSPVVYDTALSAQAQAVTLLLIALAAFGMVVAVATRIVVRTGAVYFLRTRPRAVYCPDTLTEDVRRTTYNLYVARNKQGSTVLAQRFQAVMSTITGIRQADSDSDTIATAKRDLAAIDHDCANLTLGRGALPETTAPRETP